MKSRLLSIDVFRGLTIAFMIIVNTPGSWNHVYAPLRHAKWHGVTPTDLVFPFFIFIMGVSMAFSLGKAQTGNRSAVLMKILRRTALIFLIGFLLNWFPFYNEYITDVRFFGVLQRIALSYGLAAVLIVFFKSWKSQIAVVTIGLIGYYLLQAYGGDMTLEGSINRKINDMILPAKNLYGGFGIPFDPEGIVGTISSGMHVIIGFLVGRYLKHYKDEPMVFVKHIIGIGILMIFISWLWCHINQINKPLWSSPYVLNTAGKACLLLALLVYILDIAKVQKWSFPFKVFGRNALISYVASSLVTTSMIQIFKTKDGNLYSYLYNDVWQPLLGDLNGSLAFAISVTAFVFLFAYVLYRKNIMVRL